MRFQGVFGTLKMVEQNGKVHSGVEIVEGELLVYYIAHHPSIPKIQFMKWMNELCIQLTAYHKCFERAYQYVNPYAMVISKDEKLHLLDLDTSENEEILIHMQKRVISESFHRNGSVKRTRINTDFYSFGKTLQFLIAQATFVPQINVMESHSYSKVIQKCLNVSSDDTYQTIKEIQKEIPKIKVYKAKSKISKDKKLFSEKIVKRTMLAAILVVILMQIMQETGILQHTSKINALIVESAEKEDTTSEQEVGETILEDYVIETYLLGDNIVGSQEEIMQILLELEVSTQEESAQEVGEKAYYLLVVLKEGK